VNVQGLVALAAQSDWTVNVDSANTPAPGDDRYTVTGTQQGGSGFGGGQLNVQSVVVDPACKLNPISGSATDQQVSLTSIRQFTLDFHAACDGKANLDRGGTVPLVFNQSPTR
jgi:hypothetical protein